MKGSDNQYVTKSDLKEELKQIADQITTQVITQVTAQVTALTGTQIAQAEDRIVTSLRDEFDRKLDAKFGAFRVEMNDRLEGMEKRLKLHTQDVVGIHSTEILEAIAGIVEPMGKRINKNWGTT